MTDVANAGPKGKVNLTSFCSVRDVTMEAASADSRDVDSGWSWVILISVFLWNFLAGSTINLVGVLYVEFLEYFQGGTIATSWIGFSWSISMVLLSPVGGYLKDRCSFDQLRVVLSACLVLQSLGMAAAGYIPNLAGAILLFGVSGGAVVGLVGPGAISMLGIYFKKYRGVASSVLFCGATTATLVFPPLLVFLVDRYTFPGTLLIMGALGLHGLMVPAAMTSSKGNPANLSAPSHTHSRLKQQPAPSLTDSSLKHQSAPSLTDSSLKHQSAPSLTDSSLKQQSAPSLTDSSLKQQPASSLTDPSLKQQTKEDVWKTGSRLISSSYAGSPSGDSVATLVPVQPDSVATLVPVQPDSVATLVPLQPDSVATLVPVQPDSVATLVPLQPDSVATLVPLQPDSVATLVQVQPDSVDSGTIKPSSSKTIQESKLTQFCHAVHHYKLLRKPRIFVLSFMFLCSAFGYFGTLFTFPSLGREVNMTKLNAYLLISLPAATELVSRIMFGLITDKGFVTKFRLLMISNFLSGSELLIFSFFPGEVSLLVCSALFGITGGLVIILAVPIFMDTIAEKHHGSISGWFLVLVGVGSSICSPCLSATAEYTGTFLISLRICGFTFLLGFTTAVVLELTTAVKTFRKIQKIDKAIKGLVQN